MTVEWQPNDTIASWAERNGIPAKEVNAIPTWFQTLLSAQFAPINNPTFTGIVAVLAITAANQPAQVTAYDATIGRLAIGGIEMGNTGWRILVSWDSSGVYTYNALGSLGSDFVPQGGVAGGIRIKRSGNYVSVSMAGINAANSLTADTSYTIFTPSPSLPTSFRSLNNLAFPGRFATHGLNVSGGPFVLRVSEAINAGTIVVSSDYTETVGIVSAPNSWPTSLPGQQHTAPITG